MQIGLVDLHMPALRCFRARSLYCTVTCLFAGPRLQSWGAVREFAETATTHLGALLRHCGKMESPPTPHRPAIMPAILCLLGWVSTQGEWLDRSHAQQLLSAILEPLARDSLEEQLAAMGDPSWAHSAAAAVRGGAFLLNCPHTLRALLDGAHDGWKAADTWMVLAAHVLGVEMEERGEGEEASNKPQPERALGIIWEYGLPGRVLQVGG